MRISIREKLLDKLDRQQGITIQTLCQLAEEPIALVSEELRDMQNALLVYFKSQQYFLTAQGAQQKEKGVKN